MHIHFTQDTLPPHVCSDTISTFGVKYCKLTVTWDIQQWVPDACPLPHFRHCLHHFAHLNHHHLKGHLDHRHHQVQECCAAEPGCVTCNRRRQYSTHWRVSTWGRHQSCQGICIWPSGGQRFAPPPVVSYHAPDCTALPLANLGSAVGQAARLCWDMLSRLCGGHENGANVQFDWHDTHMH